MLVRCHFCKWYFQHQRRREHEVLHDILMPWPCTMARFLPLELDPREFPMSVVGILLNGMYSLQPDRNVSFIVINRFCFEWVAGA